MMKHLEKPGWKSNVPWFSYGYRKCMFVNFLTEYIDPPIVSIIECRIVINIWRRSPISFKYMSLWCWLFDPPELHTDQIEGFD